MKFQELNLDDRILKAVVEQGYESPTPIQEQAIPVVLNNQDVLACAQTGTGKTAAFSLPIINLLANQSHSSNFKPIKALILTPTRELALQIEECVKAYSKYTDIKSAVIFGGVSQGKQVNQIKAGVDVLIATPGRLLDLMNQGFVKLNHVGIFVLDEADRMLDMGFINDIKKVIKVIPSKRQTLLFSATMPKEIQGLANSLLVNPKQIAINAVSSTAEKITQELYYVDKGNKIWLLIQLIEEKKINSVLIFTKTKHGADKLVRMLEKNKVKAAAIHGNKSQNARQRALSQFKDGELKALVATDIAARGIDVDDLKFVVNYEISNQPETYVHRIGRTGRAGKDGTAISFCDIDEKAFIKDIEKIIKIDIPVIDNHPFPMTNFTLSPPKQQGRRPARANGGVKKGQGAQSAAGKSDPRKKSFRKWK